jgi:hypothetical protein
MEQAYIDAAVHLDSAARRHLEYAQDVDALVMTNSDSAGLDRAGQAVKEVLAGQTAFLWLMVADSEMLAALDQIETASLQLAVTDGPLPELARTFAQANVTDLMMNQLLPPAEAGATFDTVTHLSFFNPTLRGLEVAATQFPNLESLSVGCQSDRVDYWRATTLEQATELTSLSVGTSSVHPWYDPAWTPDQTPVDAESLALWLIDHPYTIETFNGSALASFVPTESLDEIADYRSWSLQQVAGQIADQTPSYQASPDGVGLDRGLVVKLDSPPSGWSSSYDAGGAGADYSGLPADRLAHVPEDIRFLAVVQVRAGGREGVYRNSSGVETGLALFGLTSVQVFDVVNQIAHPAADTASTPAPDSVRGGGDHHGPMEPQSAIDRLIGSLI